MLRCYTDLIQLPTFKERYEYLRLGGNARCQFERVV